MMESRSPLITDRYGLMYLLSLRWLPWSHNHRFARAELARKQKEYETELKQRMMTQAKASSTDTAPVLATLPKIPYLTSEGLISDPGATPQVRSAITIPRLQGNSLTSISWRV